MSTDRTERGRARRAAKAAEREGLGFTFSRAQRRYLNRLRRSPRWRGVGGRQPQTRRALLRLGAIVELGDRDEMRVCLEDGRWRWK